MDFFDNKARFARLLNNLNFFPKTLKIYKCDLQI